MKLSSSSTESPTIINKDEFEKKEQEVKQLNPLDPPGPKDVPFWGEDPNILFRGEYLYELFPVAHMSYNQKLNALSRTIILLTLISIMLSGFTRSVFIGFVTLAAVYILHHYHNKESLAKRQEKEGFDNPVEDLMQDENIVLEPEVFDAPKSSNPFSNVLMTDYDYNPDKKPAPPYFNQNVNEEILTSAKKMVQEINHDQPNIQDKLFRSLGEEMVFEQSLRPFHSTSSTTIPNDQQAFAEFCYGSMISCKEGNPFACARSLARHTNY